MFIKKKSLVLVFVGICMAVGLRSNQFARYVASRYSFISTYVSVRLITPKLRSFNATGNLPLNAGFEVTLQSNDDRQFTMDFGNGSPVVHDVPHKNNCVSPCDQALPTSSWVGFSHRYSQPGTYIAKAYADNQVIGQEIIDAEANGSESFKVSPTTGTAPLSVSFFIAGSSACDYANTQRKVPNKVFFGDNTPFGIMPVDCKFSMATYHLLS